MSWPINCWLVGMSSLDTIYKKMAASLDHDGAGSHLDAFQKFDPSKHIAPNVAHDLNNILTIIQGYADRLLIKHREEPTLQPSLKLISEASRRAANIIREATPAPSSRQIRSKETHPIEQPVAA